MTIEKYVSVRSSLILRRSEDEDAPSHSIQGRVVKFRFIKYRILILSSFLCRPLTKEDKLNSRISDLKEKNAALSKVNGELQRELKTVGCPWD